MENKKFYKVEDFLKDDSFINYVLSLSSPDEKEWDNLLKTNEQLWSVAEEARDILLASSDVLCELTFDETVELKGRIFKSIDGAEPQALEELTDGLVFVAG